MNTRFFSSPFVVACFGLLASAAIALPAPAQTTAPSVAQAGSDVPIEPTIDQIVEFRESRDRIVGGAAAVRGQWPSLVAIFSKRANGNPFNFCGGTVIGKEWVLTAAHCAAAMKREPASTTFFIREGTNNLAGSEGRDIPIGQIFSHIAYDPRLTLNDVALLKLSRPSSAPRQKLAARNDSTAALQAGRSSTVAGFGLTRPNGSGSTLLLQTDVPIVAQTQCSQVYGADRIGDANFCAGLAEGGRDSCQGDSGGPLFMPRKGSGEQMQVGIVSWGRGCAQSGYPGVYATVAHFQDWIRDRVGDVDFGGALASSAAVEASVGALTEGAPDTNKPSQLAQVTIDIAEGGKVKLGRFIEVRVTSSVAGAVVIFNENPDGRSYQLYPSRAFPAPGANPALARIEPGRVLSIPSAVQRDAGYRFVIRPPTGVNKLRAVVVPQSKRMEEIAAEHYDGGTIRDLGLVLNEIVDAEFGSRGPEPVKINPVDRGTAERVYEIVD